MPLVRECRFTAIDFESAGAARGRNDTAVQIGLACWSTSGGFHDPFVSYLATDEPIQWSAQKVHGITTEHLAQAPSLLSLWPELKQRLSNSVVVAHGKGTEKRFLRAFPSHGFGPWVDTLLLARAAWPDLPDHSLGALCTCLGLQDQVLALAPERRWHDALFDAFGSLVLLSHLIAEMDLGGLPLAHLLSPDNGEWHRSRRSPTQ